MRESALVWTGNSDLNGQPIAVFARVGANRKVKGKVKARQVLALSVVPMVTVSKVRAADHGQSAIKLGTTYRHSLIDGAIDSVCDDTCAHKGRRNGETLPKARCYAQYNAQSVSEPITTIRKAGPAIKARPNALRNHLRAHRFQSGDKYRLMVVGSTGAIPAAVVDNMLSTFADFGMQPLAYVENWRDRPDLCETHMASCYTLEDLADARAEGWRGFYSPAAEQLGNVLPEGATLCPGSVYRKYAGLKIMSCADCGLCDGAGKGLSIVSPRHGNGDASRVQSLVRKGVLGRLIYTAKGKVIGAYAAA